MILDFKFTLNHIENLRLKTILFSIFNFQFLRHFNRIQDFTDNILAS